MPRRDSTGTLRREIAALRSRLAESEETLRAISSGAADYIIMDSPTQTGVFAVEGSENPYRMMVETMDEGAVTVSPDDVVLYCNQRFADMVEGDPKTIIGNSLLAHFAGDDAEPVAAAIRQSGAGTSRVRATLRASDATAVPVAAALHRQTYRGSQSIAIVITDLSDVTAAQDKLRRSEERYRSMVTVSSDVVWMTDGAGKIVDDLESWRRFTGQSAKEMLGDGWTAAVHPDDRARTIEVWRQAVQGRTPCEIYYRLRRCDGEYRRMVARGVPVFDAGGAIREWIGACVDITEKKQAETRLIDSERRYRRLFETAKDGILILDADTAKIIDVNPFLVDLLGYSYDEYIGKTLWNLGPFYDSMKSRENFAELSKTGYIRYDDLPLEAKDGQKKDVEFVSNSYVVGDRKVIQCNIRDITERKRAADAILESEAKFRSLVEQNVAGIFIIREDGTIGYVNPFFADLLGYAASELIGKPLLDIIPEDEKAAAQEKLQSQLSGQAEFIQHTLTMPTRDGRPIDLLVNASRSMLEGRPALLAVVLDISDRRRAERSLVQVNRTLRTLSSGNEALIRAVSEQNLLDEMCRILVEVGGYRAAYVGMVEEDAEKIVRLVARVGTAQYLETAKITGADVERGWGPTGTAIRTGEPQINQDFATNPRMAPWRDAAIAAGYGSSIALPLKDASGAFGALTIYAAKPDAFDSEEVRLLTELSSDLAFGVTVQRDRKAREEGERQLKSVSDNLPGALFRLILKPDQTLDCTYVSSGALNLWGINPDDIMRDPSCILGTPEEYARIVASLQRSTAELVQVDYDIQSESSGGIKKWVRMISRPRHLENGELACDGIALDVTELKEAEAYRDHLIRFDALTGLPNRLLFADRLGQALAQAGGDASAVNVVALELLSLQNIADSAGLAASDAAVREAGRRLSLGNEADESIAHVGGGVFLALIIERGAEHPIAARLQAIGRAFAAPLRIADRDLVLEIAIGIAVGPTDNTDAETLIGYARTALNRSKRPENGDVQFYDAAMTASAVALANIENDLRRAIDRSEFIVFYQPLVDSQSFEIVGAEALVRWQHPRRGLVPPGEFIPIAEVTGLIVPIGEFVLRQACRDAKAWTPAGFAEIPVSVNLSGKQLAQPGLATTILSVLAETGLDPRRLKLEVTESIFMRDIEPALLMLTKLLNAGVRFSIDDFGVEQSSLARLAKVPFEELKLDMSFIRSMTRDRSSAAVVQAIISMAHAMGKHTVAEGVETFDQVVYLRAYACDVLQGYLFSRPVALDRFRELLESRMLLPNTGKDFADALPA